MACGSSYHSALVAKYAIEHWVKLPTEVDIASEFRYRDPVLTERTLCVGVSQSGETLDTSEAMREAARLGAKVLVVSNVVDSSMARAADGVLYTRAGPEIGVASTKCHMAQIVALEILGLTLAQYQGTLAPTEIAAVLGGDGAPPRSGGAGAAAGRPRWTTWPASWSTPGTSSSWVATSASPWRSKARSSSRNWPTCGPRATRPASSSTGPSR